MVNYLTLQERVYRHLKHFWKNVVKCRIKLFICYWIIFHWMNDEKKMHTLCRKYIIQEILYFLYNMFNVLLKLPWDLYHFTRVSTHHIFWNMLYNDIVAVFSIFLRVTWTNTLSSIIKYFNSKFFIFGIPLRNKDI